MTSQFLSVSSRLLPAVLALAALPASTHAHGFAGQRFFPATLTTDDPFVADELSLPTFSTIRTPDGGGTREFDISVAVSKRITPNWDIELAERYVILYPGDGNKRSGFQNFNVGTKYQLITNDPHEFIFTVGADVDIGGSGSKQVGRAPFSTYAPGVYFGKGFGDLPDSLPLLRPLALTGQVNVAIPSSASTRTGTTDAATGIRSFDVERNAVSLQYGFAVEYSFIYLQEHVRNVGLRAPFDRLIPLVEFAISTPLDRGQAGKTTGTINPGVIWSGRFCQFGVEALIPLNSRTGSNVGVLGQLHFYLDDLFPHSIGRPIFGGNGRAAASNTNTGK